MIVILNPQLVSQQAISGTIEALTLLDTKPEVLSSTSDNIILKLTVTPGSIRSADIEAMPGVTNVCFEAPITKDPVDFKFQDLLFSDKHCHLFAGLNAIGSIDEAEYLFKTLKQLGQTATRIGVYKPRTFPNSFQGLGDSILSELFSLADTYGIQTIAMEIMSEHDFKAVSDAVDSYNVDVIWQIGTRNAQNFSLLKSISHDHTRPILYKRGFGNEISEMVGAISYLKVHGANVITCLRGVKSIFAQPARNLSDFGQIPMIKRMTETFICADPSHTHGLVGPGPLTDIHHLTAQAVISGANMVLLDVHPEPIRSKVDSRQALSLEQLPSFIADMKLVHQTYLKRYEQAMCVA